MAFTYGSSAGSSLIGSILGSATTTNIYQQQLSNGINYDQSIMGQLQSAFAFNQYGQMVAAISPEKILKKAKGILAELREEIDAWHGNILRA
jgi:hypothetical protein